MAGELKHTDAGTQLTSVEDNATDRHVLDSQAKGDLVIAPLATGGLGRLAITDDRILISSGGLPVWSATLPAFTLGGALTLNAQSLDAGSGNAKIATTGVSRGLDVVCTNDGTDGSILRLETISASAADEDGVATIHAIGRDDAGTPLARIYARNEFLIEDATTATASGKQVWKNMHNAATNTAMTLSAAGILAVDDSAAATYADNDHPVGLFDKYDDAIVLKQGIGGGALAQLVEMGVYEQKIDEAHPNGGHMMRIQPMMKLLAGGVYQNRARIDDLVDVLVAEFPQVAERLGERNLIALPQGRN